MVLWLIGMMGSGKTTVGERVADELALSFIDTDLLVVSVSARSIPDLWEAEGEEAFRALERQVISSAADAGPAVVATGGGAVLDRTNTDLMRSSGLVVWLSAAATTLEERIGRGGGRPLLDGGPSGSRLTSLLEERKGHYVAAAHTEVPTDGRSVASVAKEVVELWHAS